jgi:cytochrome c-type biogenesis protein
VIPVQAPTRLITWASRLGADSLVGAFLMGATSGLVAAPCGAPAFVTVLAWVAATQNAVWGFISLFVFSLGMTAVLVVVGLLSGTIAALPRSGVWLLWVKRIAATIMLAMAEYYFVKAGQVW